MNKAAYKTGAILTLAGVRLCWLGKMWGKDGTCAYMDIWVSNEEEQLLGYFLHFMPFEAWDFSARLGAGFG